MNCRTPAAAHRACFFPLLKLSRRKSIKACNGAGTWRRHMAPARVIEKKLDAILRLPILKHLDQTSGCHRFLDIVRGEIKQADPVEPCAYGHARLVDAQRSFGRDIEAFAVLFEMPRQESAAW